MPSQRFPGYADSDTLALLDKAFEEALRRVNGHAHPLKDGEARLVIAERIMARATTGETQTDRLVVHAMRGFPRLRGDAMIENQKQISVRAYEIWEQEGRPEGRDLDHWDRAAREIGAGEEKMAKAESPCSAPPAGGEPHSAAGRSGKRAQTDAPMLLRVQCQTLARHSDGVDPL